MTKSKPALSRRTLLRMGFTIPSALLAACAMPPLTTPATAPTVGPAGSPTNPPVALPTVTETPGEPAPLAQRLPPTPACADDDEPTPAQTEGPYFTPNSPQRASFLEPGITGVPMLVSGYVLSTTCQPIASALLDFWHCDDAGRYDNEGYRLRGHFFADETGYYQLETIMPAVYPGRTRHFHVKVQAPNGPILTTQLYFPGEPENERDGIFRPECLMDVQPSDDGVRGVFNFVLA
jgi:hypothetical protein